MYLSLPSGIDHHHHRIIPNILVPSFHFSFRCAFVFPLGDRLVDLLSTRLGRSSPIISLRPTLSPLFLLSFFPYLDGVSHLAAL